MYDHKLKAVTRVYWQYKNSPKLRKWIEILPEVANDSVESQLEKIHKILDLDTAEGEQLDICGRIAGIPKRPKIFKIGLCKLVTATDDLFRMIIRAKITKNNGDATIDNIKAAGDYIYGTKFTILDGQDMTMMPLWLIEDLPDLQYIRVVQDLDLLPRPQGVGMRDPRVIRYTPFGFGQHYQNFENAPYWDGGGLVNYAWRINLSLNEDEGKLNGQITSSDRTINLSGIDVTLFYTKSTGERFTRDVTTGPNGIFTDPIRDSGTFTVIAKAQMVTPICTTDDVESRAFSFTYIISGADVMLKVYDPAAALFYLRDASEAGKITINFGDGVDGKDYRVDEKGLVFANRSLTAGKTYHITIKRSDSCRFYFSASAKMVNKVTEIISVSGSRVNMTNCFTAQDELIKIHDKAFDYLPNVTTFEYCFYGCSLLSVIPDNLFKYCPFVVNFGYVFLSCRGLLYIPARLFDYNPLVSTFRYAFRLCVLLKEIPAGLFDKNTLATSFYVAFADCTGLLAFPRGLFDKATAATDFGNLIQNCNNITTDIKDIFPLDLYSAITYLTRAFSGCSKMKGSGVDFISKVPKVTAYQSHDNVFTGATALSDYYQIPAAWR